MSETPISPVRRRMIEDMSLRNFGEKTQHDYIGYVKTFSTFLGRSPATATPLRPSATTIGTHTSLQDLRCTVGASEIPIAPADRGAHLTRFLSLAAFERRPTGHGTCCELSDWGRHPKPVT